MEPRMIDFPVHPDPKGWLAVADEIDLPFEVKRVFWMWNLYKDRGHHALKTCHQLLIVPTGSMTVKTMQGPSFMDVISYNFKTRQEYGLYLPPMTWRWLEDFEPGTTCFVLCSHPFDESDYIDDFDEYVEYLEAFEKNKAEIDRLVDEMEKGLKFADEETN